MDVDGQLSSGERQLLTDAILKFPRKPRVVLEVGTWLGGGSTLHILRALHQNGQGHLWGIEADRSIYNRMIANIQRAAPETVSHFTPLFGRSQDVIPRWFAEQGSELQIDLAFLDGGDNPLEQITEFELIQERIPEGGILMAHDARMRKGKWLVPYLSRLDNWRCDLHDLSPVGLLYARRLRQEPSPSSLAQARSHLRRLRLAPVEFVAALLPSRVCRLALGLTPASLKAKLARGVR
jgi:hypothetical protein